MRNPVEIMDEDIMHNIVNTLFPGHEIREVSSYIETSFNISQFTTAELKTAAVWNLNRGNKENRTESFRDAVRNV